MRALPPAWTGLGIAELQYARHGFGGQIHVMRARRAFDEALKLDPASTEANLYRIYMLLSRGEKESARHGIANLLASRGQRLERPHGGRHRAARRRHVRRGARRTSAAPSSSTPPARPFSTTTAPASITIKTRSSWPATSLKKAWPLSRAIRCCAPRPATSRCASATLTRPSKSLKASFATTIRCASPYPRWRSATCSRAHASVPLRCSKTTPWPPPKPTARWPIAWPPISPSKATPAKRCTGCAAPFI